MQDATVLAADVGGNVDAGKLRSTIEASGGELASLIGDKLTAIWSKGNHPAAACRGALRLLQLPGQAVRGARAVGPIERSGGFLGFGTRSVLGEPIVSADKMKSAPKFFGARVVLNERVLERTRPEIQSRLLGTVRLVGNADGIKLFELIGGESEASPWSGALRPYEDAIAAFMNKDFAQRQKSVGFDVFRG